MKEYSKDIYVKFKPEEVEILHNRMKKAGVQNMSAFIRKMALNGYMIIPEWTEWKGVLSLHSRISNNLNQYTKKANETGNIYREDIAELKEMHTAQTKLLKKTLKSVIHLYDVDSKKSN
ncbi:MAG: MobC family plasmid mobilization relaxosome protein [Lachnospiraceae bacterium]|nr:MobC family plasmid mobilization relaxosome protein [Lachnospiraceae bacterium]